MHSHARVAGTWNSSARHRVGRRFASTVLGTAAVLIGGCQIRVQPGSDSIFSAFAGPTPSEAAAWAIDRYSANNRYRGTLLLSSFPFASEPVYLQVFQDNIKDPDAGVRAASARALGNHGDIEHAPLLRDALRDDDVLVRREAARALQRIHAPEVVETLLISVREPDLLRPDEPGEADSGVRTEAALALGQYAESRVLDELVRALADSSLAVNVAARESLKTLTGQDFAMDRRAWLDWLGATAQPFAAKRVYYYPIFTRDKLWYEHLPFVPQPPNEPESTPVGMALPDR
ncbi:MAG: HEAT repeat domain-containing protein [Planctomycetota bacterium]|nr:HEAT repeat domain-containing protein [Planctomycetota bacterium]